MAEPPRDGQNVETGRDRLPGVRMPQAVKALADAKRLHRRRPFFGDAARQPRQAFPGREHQAISRRLAEPKRQALLELLAAMGAQHVDGRRRQADAAAAMPGLRFLEAEPVRLRPFDRLLDAQPRAIEVDVAPAQGQ